MAELINEKDSLNEGRKKLNEAIKDSNKAKIDSSEAKTKAEQALLKSESTQEQLNQVVIDGDSSVEAAQARVDEKGQSHTTLKERIDDGFTKVKTQLAETTIREMNKNFYDSLNSARVRKPIMTIVDDDGKKEFYELIKEVLEEFKVPIASALIPIVVGSDDNEWMNEEQIKELHELGAEFVSHTHTHKNLVTLLETLGVDAVREELRLSRDWLIERGFNGDTIIYPFGQANNAVKDIVAQYYRFGVHSDGSGLNRHNTVPIASWSLHRTYIDYGVEIAKSKIDEIIAENGWLILGMHVYYEDFDVEELKEVIRYAISKGVEIVSFEDAVYHIGNRIEVSARPHESEYDGIVIDADSEIWGSKISKVRSTGMTSADAHKLVTDYRHDCITFGSVSASNAGDFPDGEAGSYEVHRFRSENYDYAVYRTLSGVTYERRWNSTLAKWENWTRKSDIISPKLESSIDFGSVPPNGTIKIEVSRSIFKKGGMAIAQPRSDMPDGIIWSYRINSDGVLEITLANVTGTSIFVGSRVWRLVGVHSQDQAGIL